MRFAGHTDCEVCDESEHAERDLEIIKAFVERVQKRAEESVKFIKGKTIAPERMYYTAMREELWATEDAVRKANDEQT